MWFYLSIFLVLALLSFIEIFFGIEKRISILIAVCISFFWGVLSCIRNGGPGDWENYQAYYTYLNYNNVFYLGIEPLYGLLNCIAKSIYENYHFFLFLENLIVMPIMCYSIFYLNDCTKGQNWDKKNSYILTMFLIIWSLSFGNIFIIRSTIAILFCLLSIKYIEKQKLLRFLFCIAIAAMFHRSAVFFSPAYFIYKLRLKKIHYFIMFFFTALILYFGNANQIMLSIANLLGDAFYSKAEMYMETGNTITYGIGYSVVFLMIKAILNIGFSLFVFLLLKKYFKNDNRYLGSVNLYFIGSILYIITLSVATAFSRVAGYYIYIQIVLIPYIFKIKEKKSFKLLIFFTLIVYLLIRMIVNLGNFESYIPFQTIFNT